MLFSVLILGLPAKICQVLLPCWESGHAFQRGIRLGKKDKGKEKRERQHSEKVIV